MFHLHLMVADGKENEGMKKNEKEESECEKHETPEEEAAEHEAPKKGKPKADPDDEETANFLKKFGAPKGKYKPWGHKERKGFL